MSSDSTVMLRRNFRHTLRNPTAVFNAVLLPIVIMLMFVYVIGGAFNVGVDYVDYATPGMIALAITYGLSATAMAVNSDMTKGIINRFKVMDISRGAVRIMLGQGGRDADAYLEKALAEFRALGERFGISFALTELADRIATRGEFADACEHYEQAISVVTEVGAIEDVIRMRSRQAQLYWLLGDKDSCAAAIADAERSAERVTWPDALAELALAKAELARWGSNAEEAVRKFPPHDHPSPCLSAATASG